MLTARNLLRFLPLLLVGLLGIALLGAGLVWLGWSWWVDLVVLLVLVNGVGVLLVRLGERWGVFRRRDPPDLRGDIDWLVERWQGRFTTAADPDAALGELVIRVGDYADDQSLNSRARRHLLRHLEAALRQAGLEEREIRLVSRQLSTRLGL